MATIETLISRSLDGELTPAEQAQLQRLLAESPDARALLREMTEVARAARRIPKLSVPAAPLEARLFQRLEAEGLNRKPAPAAPRAPEPVGAFRARGMAVAGLLLLLLMIGGAYLRFGVAPGMAHAPVTAGLETGRVVPGADRALASAADHGGMVNIPEVLLRPAGNRRGSHAAAAMARDGVTRDAARDTIAAHGAPPPALAESAPLAPEGPTAPALAAQEPSPVAAVVPPVPVVPGIRTNDHWIASFRGGIAAVDDGAGTMVRELDMKVGMQMDGGHKVSFIVGIAPAINEMRRQNTGIAMSSPTFSQIPDVTDGAGNSRNQEDEVVAYERIVRSEPWFGVGYNYSMAIVKNVSIDPGMKAGASASTWRIGAELPVSFRMSRNMSLECALSVAHVLPRNAGGDGGSLAVTNTPDHFIYEESKHQSSFTTYGVQLGIRLELLASN